MGRRVRVLLQLPLGFGSGLPYLLTGSTLGAWLAASGAPVTTVALFALVALPYSCKPLWAPLVDRFRLPWLGRRRGWMLACQLALVAALVALGAVGPAAPRALAALAVLVTLLSATQDIAGDAYRSDLLEGEERAAGAALFVAGYRLAMVLAGGVALVLADRMPWRAVYALLALGLVPAMVATWRAPEPAAATAPRTLADAVTAPLGEFFARPGAPALLAFIALFRAGDVVANVLVAPMLITHGVSQTEIGVVYKIVGTAGTIVGALGGAALVRRVGLLRALTGLAAAQALGPLSWALVAQLGPARPLLWLAVGADSLLGGLAIAALEALLLAACDRRFSATQYALLAAVSGLGGRVLAGVGGFAEAQVGWPAFFVGTAALTLPSLLLAIGLRRRLPVTGAA